MASTKNLLIYEESDRLNALREDYEFLGFETQMRPGHLVVLARPTESKRTARMAAKRRKLKERREE